MINKEKSVVLEVDSLKKYYPQSTSIVDTILRRRKDEVKAVDDVSLQLEKNEVVGVIGESGCGKTTLLHTLMALEDPTDGYIKLRGSDISEYSRSEMKKFRNSVQIMFQDPFNTLDPKMTVEESLKEPLKIHNMDDKEERIHDILEKVELQPSERYLKQLPKHLSGGEKQRVAIARALIIEPDIILADEPVSMLDVSTQASILKMLSKLIKDLNLSMLYISHDLSTVGYICDKINVMYLGRLVESGPTADIISDPKHPYTQELIKAIPIPDPHVSRERTQLDGAPLTPVGIGEGCRFRDRCPEKMEICEKTPLDMDIGDDRTVACHLYYDHEKLKTSPDESVQKQEKEL